ncbi:uncharacterized protein LOC131680027 [Topomyia yanbarensis]|uniref:uncharacterized protein LOC131680027 n=1 Tax=Topomyia yanbarensis TaxID=2498891 RepID=UPI00273BE0A5|nr:uncharacterized protein LOC131680027 [Topomyia yanbarensis]
MPATTTTNSVVSNLVTMDELHNSMERFWEIEEDKSTPNYSPDETKCEEHFLKWTSRDKTGRYMVRLPRTDSAIKLSDNEKTALHRFFLLEKRLARDPKLDNRYKEFMKECIHLGHMTPISERQKGTSGYYLPHHPVVREDSATTKVRVVFDASCKSQSGISLNDTLLVQLSKKTCVRLS